MRHEATDLVSFFNEEPILGDEIFSNQATLFDLAWDVLILASRDRHQDLRDSKIQSRDTIDLQ